MLATPPLPTGPRNKGNGARTVYLQPGQLLAVDQPTAITTILGSCVAIAFWDTRREVAGLNHFMLPYPVTRGDSSPRFGSVAFLKLLAAMERFGVTRDRLRAGIFGGACVMEAFRGDGLHIGARNVALARQLLADASIPVVQSDLGGRRGRKLIFDAPAGAVEVRLL